MKSKKGMMTPEVLIIVIVLAVTFFIIVGLATDWFSTFSSVPQSFCKLQNKLGGKLPPRDEAIEDLKNGLLVYYHINNEKPEIPTEEFKFGKCVLLGDLQPSDLQPDDNSYTIKIKNVGTDPTCVKASIEKEISEHFVILNKC